MNLAVRTAIGVDAVRRVGGQAAADIKEVRAQKGQFRYVGGHIKYTEAASIFENAIYVTAIRNPLHRVLSHYFFVLRATRDKPVDGYVEDMPGEGFFTYYRRKRRIRSNLNCRFICGEADHRQAIRSLREHFTVAWLSDRPETGWPYVFRMLEPDSTKELPPLDLTNAAPVAETVESLPSGARPRDYDTFLTEENRRLVTEDNLEDLKLFEWLSAEGGLFLSPTLHASAAPDAASASSLRLTG